MLNLRNIDAGGEKGRTCQDRVVELARGEGTRDLGGTWWEGGRHHHGVGKWGHVVLGI